MQHSTEKRERYFFRIWKCKSNLLTEKQQLEEKQKKCQDAISSCEKCIFDKEQKVEILKKKIKDQKIKALPKPDLKNAFTEFVGKFNESQIIELRSMNMDKRYDSSFILYTLRCLYADDLEKVKNKSIGGKKKEPITPEKMSCLKTMYTERLTYVSNKEEATKRTKKFNTHIKNGLTSCQRKPKEMDEFIEINVSNTENDILLCSKRFNKNITIRRLKVDFSSQFSKFFFL